MQIRCLSGALYKAIEIECLANMLVLTNNAQFRSACKSVCVVYKMYQIVQMDFVNVRWCDGPG